MRSTRQLLLISLSCFAVSTAAAQNKINPNTQINWPMNITLTVQNPTNGPNILLENVGTAWPTINFNKPDAPANQHSWGLGIDNNTFHFNAVADAGGGNNGSDVMGCVRNGAIVQECQFGQPLIALQYPNNNQNQTLLLEGVNEASTLGFYRTGTGAIADQTRWGMGRESNGTIHFNMTNDAITVGSDFLTCTSSTYNPTGCTFPSNLTVAPAAGFAALNLTATTQATEISMRQNQAGTDLKQWVLDTRTNDGSIHLEAANDAGTGSNDAMVCTRTGAAPTGCIFKGGIATTAYTVAALPVCNSTIQGIALTVTDATAPTYLGHLTGGGTVFTPVICTGSAWVSY